MEYEENLVIISKKINELRNKIYFEKIKNYIAYPSSLSSYYSDLENGKNIYEIKTRGNTKFSGLYTYHNNMLVYGKHDIKRGYVDFITFKIQKLYEKIIDSINKNKSISILLVDEKTYNQLKEENGIEQKVKFYEQSKTYYNIIKTTQFI